MSVMQPLDAANRLAVTMQGAKDKFNRGGLGSPPDPGSDLTDPAQEVQPAPDFGGQPVGPQGPQSATVPQPIQVPSPQPMEAEPQQVPAAVPSSGSLESQAPPPVSPGVPAPQDVTPQGTPAPQEDLTAEQVFDMDDLGIGPDLMAQLKKKAAGGMSIGEAIALAGLAANNPQMAMGLIQGRHADAANAQNMISGLRQQIELTKRSALQNERMEKNANRRYDQAQMQSVIREGGDIVNSVMTAGGKIAGWAPSAAAPSIEQFGTDYGKYMTAVQEWARNETTAMAEPQRDQYIAQRFADKVIPEINKAAQRGIFATREEVTAMASAGTGYSLEETEEKLGPFIDAAVRASEEEKRLRQQKIEIAQNESEQNQAAIDLMQARVAEINDRIANGDTVRATRLLGELNDFKANLMAREMQSHSMFGLMTEVGMDDAALVYQDNVRKLQETQSWMDQIYPQIQQQLQQVAMVDPVVTGDAIYKQSFTQVYSQIDPMLQTYEQIQEWRASHPERAADYDKAALQLFQDQMTATYGEEGTKKAIAEWKRLAEEYSQ